MMAPSSRRINMADSSRVVTVPQLAWWGDIEAKLRFPKNWEMTVCRMEGYRAPKLNREGFLRAFANPIGCKPIRELAKGKKNVVILFDDMSRPTKVAEIVPFLLNELETAGVKDDQIQFICALGTHGALTAYDFAKKLGEDIIGRFNVYNHNIYENCTFIGRTSRGTPVELNTEFVNADFKLPGVASIIDPVKCTGCKSCVDACPYHVIFFNEGLNIAQKCTGCAHLLDNGWKEPRCVDACPNLAIRLMDEGEAKELISKSEIWKPELKDKVKPRVHYMNLPKKFIAGTVYDPVEKEVVIGATCTLTETRSGEEVTVETDSYGDFWFEGLKEGTFDLQIKKDSKMTSFTGLDTTEKDINLEDIPLT